MRIVRALLLFAFGLCVSLHYGRRGLMPLDHSIVFDGGWRVLSGQIPFRDYVAPNGFVAHWMQAGFFQVFGVTWFAYLLHAAVLNGLFALCVDRILRLLGGPPALALAYAMASALVLYPPIGVPYMDTHAFFFSGASLWLALEGRRLDREADGPGPRWPWLTLPTVMLAAALCKQIPSAFVLVLVLAVALRGPGTRRRLILLAAGSTAAVAALGLAAIGLELDLQRFSTYYLELPGSEAGRRLALRGAWPREVWEQARALGMVSVAGVQACLLAAIVFARRSPAALRSMLLSEGLLAVGLLFAVITINQAELSAGFVFLAAGTAQIALLQLRSRLERPWRAAATTLAILLALAAARDAWDFDTRINATRVVNDITWDPQRAAEAAPALPAALSFLQWQVPDVVPYTARDLGELADFLAGEERGFLLLGDASLLYGITGKPSAAPSLWFHPGLTQPRAGDPSAASYEDWLLERIADLDVRYLVLEGRQTWNHLTIADLPRISEIARTSRAPRRQFGGFRVVDLSVGGGASGSLPEDPAN
jgi:hypothetical protein